MCWLLCYYLSAPNLILYSLGANKTEDSVNPISALPTSSLLRSVNRGCRRSTSGWRRLHFAQLQCYPRNGPCLARQFLPALNQQLNAVCRVSIIAPPQGHQYQQHQHLLPVTWMAPLYAPPHSFCILVPSTSGLSPTVFVKGGSCFLQLLLLRYISILFSPFQLPS